MKRLVIISLFTLLFAGVIAIWNYSYYEGLEEAYIPIDNDTETPFIPSESGVFQRSEYAMDYANMPIDENHQRSMASYYNNRAYYGAPPSIPHPVSNEISMGENTCLKCHQNGGFVEKFNAYTPITPHPEMVNCRQCHVAQNTTAVFKETRFVKNDAPQIGANSALEGGPPVIPHSIHLRESCLSCHAGPAAPKEIRVTHPERINCRQCHALNNKKTEDIGIFNRNKDDDE